MRRHGKYNARRTTVDGITFHSAKEASRYCELKLLAKAGRVRALRLQPRYYLCALSVKRADCRDVNAGEIEKRRVPVASYVADFEYEEAHRDGWRLVVEDVKGVITSTYKLKKRWFEHQYGITIREV